MKNTKKKYYKKEMKDDLKKMSAVDSKHRKFYCSVCKMSTWTFHKHLTSNGANMNISSTGRKVRTHYDVSIIT